MRRCPRKAFITVTFRALKLVQRIAHERLTRICFNDYDREIALVAELKPGEGGEREKFSGSAV